MSKSLMVGWSRAWLGCHVGELATPALAIDLAAMERNVMALHNAVATCSSTTAAAQVTSIRIHSKAIKSSALLQWLGFERVCAQTVVEAERMVVGGGCRDVLLTNQVVGANKLKRLTSLASQTNGNAVVGVLVDDLYHVDALKAAAVEAGVTLTAYVEVDGGQARCGVAPPTTGVGNKRVVELAQQIIAAGRSDNSSVGSVDGSGSGGLEWGGIHAYNGGVQHVRSAAERRDLVLNGACSSTFFFFLPKLKM